MMAVASTCASTEHPRLDWHLDNWTRYMRIDDTRLQTQTSDYWATGFITCFDEMVETCDLQCAAAMDALVTGLSISERVSVYHHHLGAVWQLARLDIAVVYQQARDNLSDGLRRKAIW